jgi:hypothetical protein
VTDWMIQLRLTVDETMLEEAKRRMSELAAELETRPRFVTAQTWYVYATEQLKHSSAKTVPGVPGRDLPFIRRTKRGKGTGPAA